MTFLAILFFKTPLKNFKQLTYIFNFQSTSILAIILQTIVNSFNYCCNIVFDNKTRLLVLGFR